MRGPIQPSHSIEKLGLSCRFQGSITRKSSHFASLGIMVALGPWLFYNASLAWQVSKNNSWWRIFDVCQCVADCLSCLHWTLMNYKPWISGAEPAEMQSEAVPGAIVHDILSKPAHGGKARHYLYSL